MEHARPRLAFIGWGAIARATVRLLGDAPVEIVAVAIRDAIRPRPDLPPRARLITTPQELAGTGAELVIEAAGRDSVAQWGYAALESGADLIVSSVSAFADADLLDSLQALALENDAQIHVPPGALGGVDALAAARASGLDRVEHRIIKPPHVWLDTVAETLCDLGTLSGPEAFFSGTAAEAASQFPKNANVAMTTALAGVGPAKTLVTLIADPDAEVNRHEITASGGFGEFSMTMNNNALEENPKSSAMVALSLVRAIRNRISPLVI